jgi:magnesium-transporting ATPase (P-type)
MVKTNIKVTVSRSNNNYEEIPSELLVPGDIISIPSASHVMTCDAVLLNGTCIVNESMLTGESIPIIKTPLPQPETNYELYDVETHKRHTLFSGTQIVQTRSQNSERILAVVIRTGFDTSKGNLVRSILFPKPIGFKFYKDSLKFVLFLFFVALLGMVC